MNAQILLNEKLIFKNEHMSGKNNPRYFETVGTNVLKLIFSFVVWKWKMTTPMEFFPENGTKAKMIHS